MKTNPKATKTKITGTNPKVTETKTTGITPKTTKTKTTVKKPRKITKKDDIKTMVIDKNYEPKQPEINNTKNTNHSNLLQTITNSILIIFTTINIIKMIINLC